MTARSYDFDPDLISKIEDHIINRMIFMLRTPNGEFMFEPDGMHWKVSVSGKMKGRAEVKCVCTVINGFIMNAHLYVGMVDDEFAVDYIQLGKKNLIDVIG